MYFLDIDKNKKLKVDWSCLDSLFISDENKSIKEVITSEILISKELTILVREEIISKSLNNIKTRKSQNENKSHTTSLNNLAMQIFNILNDQKFISKIESYFKFPKGSLKPDFAMSGGGIHLSRKNQFLKLHQDFTFHVQTHRKRVLNLILYLNPNWNLKDGGELTLERESKNEIYKINEIVNPSFNQVLFRTDTSIWHGVSKIKSNNPRISIAIYYYLDYKFLGFIKSLLFGRMTLFKSHRGIKLLIPYFQHKVQILLNIFRNLKHIIKN